MIVIIVIDIVSVVVVVVVVVVVDIISPLCCDKEHTSRRRSRYFCFGKFVYPLSLACKSQDCWKMHCLQYTNTRSASNHPQSAGPIPTFDIVSFI